MPLRAGSPPLRMQYVPVAAAPVHGSRPQLHGPSLAVTPRVWRQGGAVKQTHLSDVRQLPVLAIAEFIFNE